MREILFQRTREGFTLLDLLMVICIVGILCMLGIPQFHSMLTQSKLNDAATELHSALQYAGDLAVRYQRPFGVEANASGEWFRVFDNRYKLDPSTHHDEDPPVDTNGIVLNPVDKKWYLVDFDTRASYEGVDIYAVPAGGEVCFHPDGHSSSSNSTFAMSLGRDKRAVVVNGATGAITVQAP